MVESLQRLVAEINSYHEKNTKYDAEYYNGVGIPPEGNEEPLQKVMGILEKHLQRTASMEFHALVRAPSKKEAIYLSKEKNGNMKEKIC